MRTQYLGARLKVGTSSKEVCGPSQQLQSQAVGDWPQTYPPAELDSEFTAWRSSARTAHSIHELIHQECPA